MVNAFIKKGIKLEVIENFSILEKENDTTNIIWIDMISPSIEEVKTVESIFNIKFPTKQESEEIELSSRYWEEDNRIEINSYFLINADSAAAFNET
ncbi:MAG: magnesium and cobalt transport protein CorA, partial [Campylobacterota bacterium]